VNHASQDHSSDYLGLPLELASEGEGTAKKACIKTIEKQEQPRARNHYCCKIIKHPTKNESLAKPCLRLIILTFKELQ
jgi:hypothetical protein